MLLALLVVSAKLILDTRWRGRWRTLSLMAKCLILSLLLHALLGALFTAWQVRTSLAGLIARPAVAKVSLVTRSSGSGSPARPRSVGKTSMVMAIAGVTRPAGTRPGQRTIMGTRTPPS